MAPSPLVVPHGRRRALPARRARSGGGARRVALSIRILAILAFILAARAVSGQQVRSIPTPQQVLVPAYGFSDAEWRRLVAGGRAVSPVVLDIGVGSGTIWGGANLGARLAEARAAGVRVLGYVPTAYGKGAVDEAAHPTRTPQKVQGYIDEWYRLAPGLDGIFFDEGPLAEQQAITPKVVEFYTGIYRHVKARSAGRGTVVLNATESDQEWVMTGASDVAVLYEGPPAKYARYQAPAWASRYPPARIAHLVFEVPSCPAMVGVVARGKRAGAGVVYVYTGSPTAYDRLPGYWEAQLRAARAARLSDADSVSAAELEGDIRDMQELLPTVPPSGKPPIIARINRLREQQRRALCP